MATKKCDLKILEMDIHRTTYGRGEEFEEVLRRKSTPTKNQQVKFENQILNFAHTTKDILKKVLSM
jgi:flagellar hook-basal body complex protein FliE